MGISIYFSNYDEALKILRRATAVPRKKIGTSYHDQKEPVQNHVHKSIKVWSMYADLEESLGTFQVGILFSEDRPVCEQTLLEINSEDTTQRVIKVNNKGIRTKVI